MDRPIYDTIGRSYGSTRSADPRITAELVRLTGCAPGATVCDIGAGSGNYTNALADAGFTLLAVEPSEAMRAQARPHDGVTWFAGSAEAIPLEGGAAEAVVCTLAAHHFRDLRAGLREMERVCPEGPHVFFTFDPYAGKDHWFAEYFPEILENDFALFPSMEAFAELAMEATGRAFERVRFPLPCDLADQFMYAPWAKPETYLDPSFRANMSGFRMVDPDVVSRGVGRLSDDLASGAWDARFGDLRTRAEHDAGFVFVTLRR